MKRTTSAHHPHATLEVIPRAHKRIIVPVDETTSPELLLNRRADTAFLTEHLHAHPELFPPTILDGGSCDGFTDASVTRDLRLRRIQTTADGEVWHIHPSVMMPYMTCDTATADDILLLAHWAPDWALARVFGNDGMTVSRLRTSRGRSNLVGTTVKDPAVMPTDVVADEKHRTITGETVDIATTVGRNCFLGASVSPGAGEADVTAAYRQFQREAPPVPPDDQPDTVHPDGWQATMNAWTTRFPQGCVMPCVLHAVVRLNNVATTASQAL